MRRSGRGCGKGGTVQAAMAELDPRDGKSGREDTLGVDEGGVVLLLDEDDEEPPVSLFVFVFVDLDPLDEEKIALNTVVFVTSCECTSVRRTKSGQRAALFQIDERRFS